jgi:hypothetical protein
MAQCHPGRSFVFLLWSGDLIIMQLIFREVELGSRRDREIIKCVEIQAKLAKFRTTIIGPKGSNRIYTPTYCSMVTAYRRQESADGVWYTCCRM